MINSLLFLGFIWLAVPQENKRVADNQYILVIILFVLLILLSIFMSFNLANCGGDCL